MVGSLSYMNVRGKHRSPGRRHQGRYRQLRLRRCCPASAKVSALGPLTAKSTWYQGVQVGTSTGRTRELTGGRTLAGRHAKASRPATTCSASTTTTRLRDPAAQPGLAEARASSASASSDLPWELSFGTLITLGLGVPRSCDFSRDSRRASRTRRRNIRRSGPRPSTLRLEKDFTVRAARHGRRTSASSTSSTERARLRQVHQARPPSTRTSATRAARTTRGASRSVRTSPSERVSIGRRRSSRGPATSWRAYSADRRVALSLRPRALRLAPAAQASARAPRARGSLGAEDRAFLDDLEHRTFRCFWDQADPTTGLVPDRAPTPSFSSVAAVGFGLDRLPIGAERGWVTREEARAAVAHDAALPARRAAGPGRGGRHRLRGFFYHFLDMQTGTRFETVELSTIDTALLSCRARSSARRTSTRAMPGGGGDPRARRGALPARRLALGGDAAAAARSHGLDARGGVPHVRLARLQRGHDRLRPRARLADPSARRRTRGRRTRRRTAGGPSRARRFLNFAPLFGHQYSHVWIDFRGIRDAYMRAHGHRLLRELAPRHARAARLRDREPGGVSRATATDVWGLTACDGPADVTLDVDGRAGTLPQLRRARRRRRATSATTARSRPRPRRPLCRSRPSSPSRALRAMRAATATQLYGPYGFRRRVQSRPSRSRARSATARVAPGQGWFDVDSLGIDQGPIVAMIENHRSGLVWKTMRRNPAHRARPRRAPASRADGSPSRRRPEARDGRGPRGSRSRRFSRRRRAHAGAARRVPSASGASAARARW